VIFVKAFIRLVPHQLTTYLGARETPAGKENQQAGYQVNNAENEE